MVRIHDFGDVVRGGGVGWVCADCVGTDFVMGGHMKRRHRIRVGDVVVILDCEWARRSKCVGHSGIVVLRFINAGDKWWVVDYGICVRGFYYYDIEYLGVDVRYT